ncbi:MAG: DUF2141 domain-containing protein [Sphingomonadaceae bacterium]|nr:DUF2141 domain-containing protein [Sphingomonadaceae bacterium]
MIAALIAAAVAAATPTPDYGIAEGQCRPHETGPAAVVTVEGLRDRTGKLRLELYSPVDGEFGGDDRDLVRDGKVFRRAVMPIPASGPVEMCIRAPHAGEWALILIHERAGRKKFDPFMDGAGFSGNPRVGKKKPPAAEARIEIGRGPTPTAIRLNYLHGLFQFGPIKDPVT